jgi:leader peptidase (prepilin peptidase)/N-methyltransferase
MLEREWHSDCRELLAIENAANQDKFNLITPRSRCSSCNNTISALENIPIISYLLQRGKCKHCQSKISVQYPLIEIFTGIVTGIAAYQYGVTWQMAAAAILLWALISLAAIDFKTSLLPDNITLPVLWLGIIVNYFEVFCTLEESVLGAIFGYTSLWLVFKTFKLITGKDGMGYGDFKLLAMLGAWLGSTYLLPIILISSVVGSVLGIALIMSKIIAREAAIPFGPYLALGGLICLLWGSEVSRLLPTL